MDKTIRMHAKLIERAWPLITQALARLHAMLSKKSVETVKTMIVTN